MYLTAKSMLAGQRLPSQPIQADGYFEFNVPPDDEYSVLVDPASLPLGYVPPPEQDSTNFWEDSRFGRTTVRVPRAGGEFATEVFVFREALVRGSVVGPKGQPVPHCFVRVGSSEPGHAGVSTDTFTDANGLYEVRPVWPGKSYVRVIPESSTDETLRELAIPLPPELDVEEGGVYTIEPIRIGTGSKTVHGVVVNQAGEPFEGLPILCYKPRDLSAVLLQTETDSGGRFSLEGLYPERVSIHLTGRFEPNRELSDRRLAWHAPPIELDLSTGPDVVDVGTRSLWASRPFFFEASVSADGFGDLTARVEFVREPAAEELHPWAKRLREPEFDGRAGTLSWACETPHPPVRITISARGVPGSEDSVVLHPRPGREEGSFKIPDGPP
ncbi:MAG: carboxypeptidase-like regulatory domain-containing protein [Planctomycetota bacterium]